MDREEIITKIQDDINKFYKSYDSVGEDERELLAEIFDDVEKLRDAEPQMKRGNDMNDKLLKKFKRLQDRLCELKQLNENIGRLAFYVFETEHEINADTRALMLEQLDLMQSYSKVLQSRIIGGHY